MSIARREARNAKNIRNIAFEQIYKQYYWGKYGDFRVIIDIDDGYINATKLCNQAQTKGGSPKEFKEWKKLSEANDLKEEISLEDGIPSSSLTREINGRHKDNEVIKGTYVHPELIPHIASWASTKFARKVSKIVNEYFTNQAIEEQDMIIRDQEKKIAEKTDKIDELMKYITEMRAESNIKMDTMHDAIGEVKEDLDKVSIKLGIAVERRVPEDPVNERNEVFALYKNDLNIYKAIRCQSGNYNGSVKKCKQQRW